MTDQQRAERLQKHRDTQTFEIAGAEEHWFLGRVTYQLAKEKGIDLGGVLEAFEGVGESDLGGMLEEGAKLIYAGTLPFQPERAFDDVADLVSVGDLAETLPALLEHLEELESVGKAEAAAQAAQSKRDRAKRPA